MIQLRLKGMGYHKIANELNVLGIPIKTGKAKWPATTVMRILKRANSKKEE